MVQLQIIMQLYDYCVFILIWSGLLILDQREHIYALLMRCLTHIGMQIFT